MQDVTDPSPPAPVPHHGDGGPGRPPWLVPTAGVAVLALVAGGLWVTTRPDPVDDPAVAATAMATAWTELGPTAVAWAAPATTPTPDADPPGPTVAAPPTDDQLVALLGDLGPATSLDGTVTSTASVAQVTPPTESQPYRASADLRVRWDLPDGRGWTSTSTVDLVRHPDQATWVPEWSPTVVHPDLQDGDVVQVQRHVAQRGSILATDGEVVVGPRRVTEIGLHPARVDDLDGVIAAIVDVLDAELDVELDGAALRADVEAADPDHWVPVITLRNEDYQLVEPVIFPLVGTRFRDGERFLGPDADYARFTIGSVGEVTAQQLEEEPGRFQPGDLVGRSGIQEAQDPVLAGTAGWSVVATREGSDPVLHDVAATPGADITITLDQRLQEAAQQAIADVPQAASMAVVRPSDGHVLALANSPSATFDIARLGQLPPGSVFKVVTTVALLQELGVTPDTPVGCPNTIEAGGRTISNAGSLALGDTVFSQAFANSCNTSFIDLSRDLSNSALHDAAAQLGVGTDWDLGVGAASGDVPVTDGPRDLALASFGQGRTLVDPLAMATMMASVSSGATVSPRLVLPADGVPADDGAGAVGDAATPGATTDPQDGGAGQAATLPDDVATALRDLTRLVVTDGSGRAVADVPGPPVHGKTGTAEFTNADGDLSTHVWFAGFQGDLAFAVVVTDTQEGSGGGTAAPLAADFLTRVAD